MLDIFGFPESMPLSFVGNIGDRDPLGLKDLHHFLALIGGNHRTDLGPL